MVDVFTIMLGKRMFKLVVRNGMARFSWPENVTVQEVYKIFCLIKQKKGKILGLLPPFRSRANKILGTKIDFSSALTSGCLLIEYIDDNLDENAVWLLHPDWDYSVRTSTSWFSMSIFIASVSKFLAIGGVTGDEIFVHSTYS